MIHGAGIRAMTDEECQRIHEALTNKYYGKFGVPSELECTGCHEVALYVDQAEGNKYCPCCAAALLGTEPPDLSEEGMGILFKRVCTQYLRWRQPSEEELDELEAMFKAIWEIGP